MSEQNGQTALARREETRITSTRDPREATERLKAAQEKYHLVSPSTSVGVLPEGFAVQTSAVLVRQEDCYSAGKQKVGNSWQDVYGLPKADLDKISAAVGVSWDPMRSGRLDDGRDPYYCRYKSVGAYRAFDGTVQWIQGEKEMDLRPGSPQVEALEERARQKNRTAEAQIREMRLHIQSHAETKARLRAIRSLGVKSAYTADELRKPFVVARLMFTGESDDPELRRAFALRSADAALAGIGSLYGGQPQREALPPAPAGSPAPPVGSVRPDADDFDTYDAPTPEPEAHEAEIVEEAPSEPTPAPQARPAANGVDPAQFTIPGGRSKGTPLPQADEKDLRYWEDRISENLAEEPDGRFADKDRRLLSALRAELARRDQGQADIEF